MNNYLSTKAAKERKKKSMRITAMVHGVIFVLALLPFLSQMPPKPFQQTIMIQFESAGSSHSGAKKSAKRAKKSDNLTPKKAATPKISPVKALPTTPVVTSPTDAPSIPQVKDIKVEVPVPDAVPNPTPNPVPVPDVVPVDLPDIKVKEVVFEDEAQASTSSESTRAEASGEHTANGQGTGNEGDNNTDGQGEGNAKDGDGDDDSGQGGEGSGDGMFSGDGVLTRKIIERPNLSAIIAQEGMMSVNICVDKQGKVTFVEFDPTHSTIDDTQVIREALEASAYYRFEKKSNGPQRECGRLTFKIEFEDRTKKKN